MARITLEHIERQIIAEDYHLFENTLMTVCCLTLRNGFNTIGTAACADPAIFSRDLGKAISRKDAVSNIWQLEGYRLKEAIYQGDSISMFPE